MRRTLALAGATTFTMVAGCAPTHGPEVASGSSHASDRGTVTGRLIMEGGPLGAGGQQPKARPIPGLVEFTADHRVTKVRVGRSGRFSASLPPGTYRVAGRSPRITQVGDAAPGGEGRELPCSLPLSVTVTPHGSATVTLTCIVP